MIETITIMLFNHTKLRDVFLIDIEKKEDHRGFLTGDCALSLLWVQT